MLVLGSVVVKVLLVHATDSSYRSSYIYKPNRSGTAVCTWYMYVKHAKYSADLINLLSVEFLSGKRDSAHAKTDSARGHVVQ